MSQPSSAGISAAKSLPTDTHSHTPSALEQKYSIDIVKVRKVDKRKVSIRTITASDPVRVSRVVALHVVTFFS